MKLSIKRIIFLFLIIFRYYAFSVGNIQVFWFLLKCFLLTLLIKFFLNLLFQFCFNKILGHRFFVNNKLTWLLIFLRSEMSIFKLFSGRILNFLLHFLQNSHFNQLKKVYHFYIWFRKIFFQLPIYQNISYWQFK